MPDGHDATEKAGSDKVREGEAVCLELNKFVVVRCNRLRNQSASGKLQLVDRGERSVFQEVKADGAKRRQLDLGGFPVRERLKDLERICVRGGRGKEVLAVRDRQKTIGKPILDDLHTQTYGSRTARSKKARLDAPSGKSSVPRPAP
jgi:hypothetical protein